MYDSFDFGGAQSSDKAWQSHMLVPNYTQF